MFSPLTLYSLTFPPSIYLSSISGITARGGKQKEKETSAGNEGPSEWDVDLDLGKELEDIDVAPTTPSSSGKSQDKNFLVLPNPGPSYTQLWSTNSNLAADHVAGGSFESAMRVWRRYIYI